MCPISWRWPIFDSIWLCLFMFEEQKWKNQCSCSTVPCSICFIMWMRTSIGWTCIFFCTRTWFIVLWAHRLDNKADSVFNLSDNHHQWRRRNCCSFMYANCFWKCWISCWHRRRWKIQNTKMFYFIVMWTTVFKWKLNGRNYSPFEKNNAMLFASFLVCRTK